MDPGASTLVAYVDAADLWVYDAATDRRRAVTDDGDARFERSPAFLDGACLAFTNSEPASIELIELAGQGIRRTIVEEAGWISDFAINLEQRSLFYLHIDHDVDGTYRLKRVGIDGGTPETLHTFNPNLGRGAGSEDEVSVAVSPDGSMLLVVNTHEYSLEFEFGAIYLFDADGREIRARLLGTHARWSPDSGTIYFRGHAGTNGQGWSALDLESMEATRLGVTPGTNWLVVSPDGRRLAYDTSTFGDSPAGTQSTGEAPNVYVYDLATGMEAILRRGAMGPLWISSRAVLATNVRAPGPDSLNSWESLGTVSRITVGGARRGVNMTSTLFDTAVLIGT
ncbi:MAG TPA: hypothetical protein VMQ65_10395 [Candidatus Limnocylindria bacterium]|nr:hypothetical protein [Candidatus Limnocylindria bacterium]